MSAPEPPTVAEVLERAADMIEQGVESDWVTAIHTAAGDVPGTGGRDFFAFVVADDAVRAVDYVTPHGLRTAARRWREQEAQR